MKRPKRLSGHAIITEEKRRERTSSKPCGMCGATMTIGDEERLGICDECELEDIDDKGESAWSMDGDDGA